MDQAGALAHHAVAWVAFFVGRTRGKVIRKNRAVQRKRQVVLPKRETGILGIF